MSLRAHLDAVPSQMAVLEDMPPTSARSSPRFATVSVSRARFKKLREQVVCTLRNDPADLHQESLNAKGPYDYRTLRARQLYDATKPAPSGVRGKRES